jgi:hypothetical protein
MSTNTIIIAVIAVILLGAGWWYYSSQSAEPAMTGEESAMEEQGDVMGEETMLEGSAGAEVEGMVGGDAMAQ